MEDVLDDLSERERVELQSTPLPWTQNLYQYIAFVLYSIFLKLRWFLCVSELHVGFCEQSYDVREVIDTVVESETIDMPENAKEASAAPPPPLPGKPSPFSPGVDLDNDDTSHADHQ